MVGGRGKRDQGRSKNKTFRRVEISEKNREKGPRGGENKKDGKGWIKG